MFAHNGQSRQTQATRMGVHAQPHSDSPDGSTGQNLKMDVILLNMLLNRIRYSVRQILWWPTFSQFTAQQLLPIRSTAQFISHWSVTVTAQQVDYRLHLIGGGQLHCIGGVVVTHRPIHRVK